MGEPSGVFGSNDDLDKSLDDLFSEISSLKNYVPSEQAEDIPTNQTQEQSDSSLYATSNEANSTSSSSDLLRGTARTLGSISKAAKKSHQSPTMWSRKSCQQTARQKRE